MTTTATNDEQVVFRIRDDNGSTLSVERRPKDYKIAIEVNGQGVNYFYATPAQYVAFICSEIERLSSEPRKDDEQ